MLILQLWSQTFIEQYEMECPSGGVLSPTHRDEALGKNEEEPHKEVQILKKEIGALFS